MSNKAAEGIYQFLEALGVDPTTETMKNTPERVATLFSHLFDGMKKDPASVLARVYPTDYKGLVAINHIEFQSICEHHLTPFLGTVDIVYHPRDGKVVGFSKMSDLINILAHRPQLQERLTMEIANAIEDNLDVDGVMVRMQAKHFCMILQGEMQRHSVVTTFERRGSLQEQGALHAEALFLLGGNASE